MVKWKRPSLSNNDIFNIIRKGCKDIGAIGWDQKTGFGRIDAYKSLVVADTWRVDKFTGYTSFEPGDSNPFENKIILHYEGIKNERAYKCVADSEGITAHSGKWVYKFAGCDTCSDDSLTQGISFRIYDCNIPITRPTFLSYWVLVKKTPNTDGTSRITLQGYLKPKADAPPDTHKFNRQIYQWGKYGRIIDQTSQSTTPTSHKTPADGQWHQYVYSLYPAAGETLTTIHISYEGCPKGDTGEFLVYIDDIEVTHEFPISDQWYGEIFGNGDEANNNSDPNFTLLFDSLTWEPPPCPPCENKPLRIRVDGHDTLGASFIDPYPSIRNNISDIDIALTTGVSWCQYDKGIQKGDTNYALGLYFFIQNSQGDIDSLIYSANAGEDWWDKRGWVDMSKYPHPLYNEWSPEGYYGLPYLRWIWDDYHVEYDSIYGGDVDPGKILETRLFHFCEGTSNDELGGVITPIESSDSAPNELFPYIREVKNRIVLSKKVPCDEFDPEAEGCGELFKSGTGYCICKAEWLRCHEIEGGVWECEPSVCTCFVYKDLKIISTLACTETPYDTLNPIPPNNIKETSVFISWNGGKSFPETLAYHVLPVGTMEVETLMVDGNKKIKICWLSEYQKEIPYIPSSECKALFAVYDEMGNSAATVSESWEVPIISHSPKPTAFNTRPLAFNNGEIHLAYTNKFGNSNGVVWMYTKNTKPWLGAKGLSAGEAASLDKDVVVGVNNEYTLIFYALRGENGWSEPIPVKAADENLDEHFSPASVALDVNDTVHIAYISVTPQEQGLPPLHRLMYLKFHKDTPESITEEIVNVWAGDESMEYYAPSLVLDYMNRPNVGFRGGYAYWDGEWHIEELPDSPLLPSLASYGGNVYMLYSIGNTLFRRYGYGGNDWLGEDEIVTPSNLLTFELSNGFAIIWQDGDEIYIVFWDPISNTYSPPYLIGTGNYPHTLVYNDGSINQAFSVFTQEEEDYYKVAYTFTEDPYNLAYYYIELGKEEPSPFTVHREGFADGMDIGDSLTYYVPRLDSSKVYRVLMELHAPSPETVSISINGDTTEIELPGNELVGIEEIIPIGSNDLWIEIRGNDIGCKRIIVYPEVAAGGMSTRGGPQERIVPQPKIFKLYQSYPNPTTRSAVIRFQLPVKTMVSLKVYDVSGRVVRTLTRAQSLKPGIYTVEWNGRNNKGMKLPAGVYFYRLETKEYKSTKKLVWVR